MNLTSRTPEVGDHRLLIFDVSSKITTPKPTFKRNWKYYNKEALVTGLRDCRFNLGIADVQQLWNQMENQIINVVDNVAPYVKYINNTISATHPSVRLEPKILQNTDYLKCIRFQKTLAFLLESKI